MATNATATAASPPLKRLLSNRSDTVGLKSPTVPSNASHQAGRIQESTFAEAKEVVSGLRHIQTDSDATQALSLDAVLMEYHEAADNVDDGSDHSSRFKGEQGGSPQDVRDGASGNDVGAANTCAPCSHAVSAAKGALLVLACRAPRWLALEVYAYFILMVPYLTILSDDERVGNFLNSTAESRILYTPGDLMLRPAYALGVARVASHVLTLAYIKVLHHILPVTVSHRLQCFLGWPVSVLLWIPGMLACIFSLRLDAEPW